MRSILLGHEDFERLTVTPLKKALGAMVVQEDLLSVGLRLLHI